MSLDQLKKHAKNAQHLLEEFGIPGPVKLSEAQKFVARIHGYPDWDSAIRAQEAAELKAESGVFAVTTTDFSGVSHTTITRSRDTALASFFEMTYLLVHAAADGRFTVVGDDDDAVLTGLHLILGDGQENSACVLSLTTPGRVVDEPGSISLRKAGQTFTQIASEIQSAIDLHAGKLDEAEVERLKFSEAAFLLGTLLAEEMLNDARDAKSAQPAPSETTAKRTWKEMTLVRQSVVMTARVLV